MMQTIALALGSNTGDSRSLLAWAVHELARFVEIDAVASLYRTEPVSDVPQDTFWNSALVGRTDLSPEDLMGLAKALEMAAGRRPGPRHGPRPLDVDLLLYGDQVSDSASLRLPHPELRSRRFVLAPLAEIAADWPLPDGPAPDRPAPDLPGRRSRAGTVGEALEQLIDTHRVERLCWETPPA